MAPSSSSPSPQYVALSSAAATSDVGQLTKSVSSSCSSTSASRSDFFAQKSFAKSASARAMNSFPARRDGKGS